MTKASPGNAADPTNPHLFDVYRFSNPTAAPVCFSFTLTYGNAVAVLDGGSDAGADVSPAVDAGGDAGTDAGVVPPVDPALQKYLTAYGTFFPTDISLQYLADVGGTLDPPQTMAITVPANDTIDVVVYATAIAPAGADTYTLSCSTQ